MENFVAQPARSDLYSQVYEALDASIASSTCLAWSEARLQRALCGLRVAGDSEMLAEVEQMSVTLNRLALASRAADQNERHEVLERLRSAARSWMERLPIH